MLDSCEIIDISPLVSEKTAVFPGDTAFQRTVSLSFQKNDPYELSSIQTTLHVGAHADASSHYHPKGQSIDKRPLYPYLGKCQVVTVALQPNQCIEPHHIQHIAIQAPRVLFRTQSFLDPNTWTSSFNALSPLLIEALAEQKVVLVGIDTPSVDQASDKILETHQAVYKNGLAVLEGLSLNLVSDGIYTLVALPLRLENAEASPVRAVLLKEKIL